MTTLLIDADWLTEPPVLQTRRLTLRAPLASDAERQCALIGDFEVSKMLTAVAHPYSTDFAHQWISGTSMTVHDVDWAIDDGSGLIGVLSLARETEKKRRFGCWLGKPYWRRGYMREAANAALRWAFQTDGCEIISSIAFNDNAASLALHTRLGFQQVGQKIAFSKARGSEVNCINYILTREDWAATK